MVAAPRDSGEMPEMTKNTRTPSPERQKNIVLAAVSLGVMAAAVILVLFSDAPFRRYFGPVDPLFAVALVVVLGIVCLRFLDARGWFGIHVAGRALRGAAVAAVIATLFAVPTILVDIGLGFPLDINVPPPAALLFYPVMGFVVEVMFHAAPLALLLAVLSPLLKKLDTDRLVWTCILLVALIEPAFQVRFGSSGPGLSWLDGYLAMHLFAFNVAQLYVFRRYGFVSMFLFRMTYYLHWHILWGVLRLQWLF